MNEERTSILHKLIELEKSIGELYKLYAEILPDHREFWSVLAGEEMEHANWLIMLQGQIKHGNIAVQENRFNQWGVDITLNFVKNKVRFAENNKIPYTLALSTALDVEKSLLERKYYEFYKSDCPEITKILQDLKHSTDRHLNRVQRVLEKTLHSNP